MARSKMFEALLNEAGKAAKKGGDSLNQIAELSDHKQTDKRTVGKTDSQADSQTDGRTDRQTNGQSVKLSNRQIIGQTDSQSVKQTHGQTNRHMDRQSIEINFDDPFHWMTTKQAIIYSFLVENKSRVTSLGEIVEITGIPYGTVRGSLRKLTDEKCISKPQRYRRGESQGISYTVNERTCELFLDHEKHRQSLGQTDRQTIKHSDRQTVSRTDSLSDSSYYSSSSFIKNTTTCDIEKILSNHPELGYWRQKGLTVKQITGWIQTADCTPELMIQYLCYCKYEMVDLGIEKEKNILDVFNWFYRIIEKSGQYRKPTGYKSHQEKQLEAEQKLISDREKQIQELKDLHRKKYEQERDLAFWQMMSDPGGDIYKQCFDRLNDFAKRKAGKGGLVFESAMRKAFDELTEN